MVKFTALLLCFFLLCPTVRGVENEKYIALTIDDAPSGLYTRELLEQLEQREAHVTFLLCGYRIAQFPHLAREIVDGGHEIGLQGFDQSAMAGLSRRRIAKSLSDTRSLLPKDCEVRLFRPPEGVCSDGMRQVAEVTKLSILGWSVDPRQWRSNGRGIVGTVKDGDIVLIRPMSRANVKAAISLVDQLQKQGYRFVTVSELAKIRRVKLKPGISYSSFPLADADTGF